MALDFKGLLESRKRNREQPTIEEDSLESNECPVCMWRMKVREDGTKSCPVCGRIYRGNQLF